MSFNLTNKVKTSYNHLPVAAGSSDVTDCNVIDMQNFEGVRWIVAMGTITAGAVTGLRAQQAAAKSSDTALTNGADLLGTAVSIADDADDKLAILDIYRPLESYVQLVIDRATQNAEVDAVIAEQYGAKKLPIAKDASVSVQETHASPAEGTA